MTDSRPEITAKADGDKVVLQLRYSGIHFSAFDIPLSAQEALAFECQLSDARVAAGAHKAKLEALAVADAKMAGSMAILNNVKPLLAGMGFHEMTEQQHQQLLTAFDATLANANQLPSAMDALKEAVGQAMTEEEYRDIISRQNETLAKAQECTQKPVEEPKPIKFREFT